MIFRRKRNRGRRRGNALQQPRFLIDMPSPLPELNKPRSGTKAFSRTAAFHKWICLPAPPPPARWIIPPREHVAAEFRLARQALCLPADHIAKTGQAAKVTVNRNRRPVAVFLPEGELSAPRQFQPRATSASTHNPASSGRSQCDVFTPV